MILSLSSEMWMTRRVSRIASLLAFIVIICVVYYNFQPTQTADLSTTPYDLGKLLKFSRHKDIPVDKVVQKNYDTLVSILKTPIDEPKVKDLQRPILVKENEYDLDSYVRANATLTILARNSDLKGIKHTMIQIENKFNRKFGYPYVFLNDGEFSDKFKAEIQSITKSEVYFEKIDSEVWNPPDFIDKEKQSLEMKKLKSQKVAYAGKTSYHNMCRYYSVNFFNHPRMNQFKYYWRFEPNTDYFCDIDYDVFKFMELNKKVYGFVISLYDGHETVKTLWTETKKFLHENPQYLSENPAVDFLMEDMQNPVKTEYTGGYSTCHFWTNFEIADLDFYRSDAYSSWVQHLDKAGGFYYERWGDAPVHSIGLALFANKNDIHWFRDIGYKHHPYINCPNSDKCSGCDVGDFTYKHLQDQNCITNWWDFEMDESARNIYK